MINRIQQYGRRLVAGLVLSFFCAASFAATTVATTQAQKSEPTILYSQMASSATLTPTSKKGWYRLTLKGINNNTLWFTDQPVRKSGTLSDAEFLKAWNAKKADSFAQNNPNASLVAFFEKSGHEKEQLFVLRLADPVYNAESRTLQYTVQPISKNAQHLQGNAELYDVALFIDNFCPFCV